MRRILITFSLLITFLSSAQVEGWLSGGANTKFLKKKLEASAELNFRFQSFYRLDKFFPEVSAKYDLVHFLKPSVDYRYIVSRNTIGNYNGSHRINLNLNFKKKIEDLSLGFRLRYQHKVDALTSSESYQPDFDNALRLKPSIKWDIDGSKISPAIASEWYYNPKFSVNGRRFTKYRFSAGVNWNLPNRQELDIKYLLDYEINVPFPEKAHVLSLSYTYDWKRKKKNK